MNQIEELEHSLPDRLQASAALVTPDPAALALVRKRAVARRRRTRIGALASCAAAIAVVAAGAAILTGQQPSSEVTATPADDSRPTAAPADESDATLVIYRYPNVSAEILDEDPKMGGEWATLHTADRTYHANGPLSELGADSPYEISDLGTALAALDAGRGLAPEQAIAGLIEQPYAGVLQRTTASDQSAEQRAATVLFGLLASGSCTADQAAEVRRLLETLPDVTVSAADGGDTVTISHADPTIGDTRSMTIDASTGHPLRSGWLNGPTMATVGDIEYVSVTRVRAADYLIPGRGTPNSPSTSTTTEAPR